MESSKKSLARDASLLLIGAFISLLTSLIGNYLKEKSDSQKEVIRKKLEFNYDLSKALGERFYFTYNLIQHKGSNDTGLIKQELSGFLKSRQFWNQNIYSYKALLKNYYGVNTRIQFENKIYNPLVELGHYAESISNNRRDANSDSQIKQIAKEINDFMELIYSQVED